MQKKPGTAMYFSWSMYLLSESLNNLVTNRGLTLEEILQYNLIYFYCHLQEKLNNIYLPSVVVLGCSSDKIIKPLPLNDV